MLCKLPKIPNGELLAEAIHYFSMATTLGQPRNNLYPTYEYESEVLARNIIILMKLARVSDKSRRSEAEAQATAEAIDPTPPIWPEVVPDAWLTKRGGQLAKYFP